MASSCATLLVTTSLLLLMIMANIGEGSKIGLNFGRQTSQKLLPSMVVDIFLANGITKLKLFSANDGVLRAFSGSKIEITVAVPNIELVNYNSTYATVTAWLGKYVRNYIDNMDVDIRYICIGIEPFSKLEKVKNDTSYTENIVPVMKKYEKAIAKDSRLQGNVKLSVPMNTDIFEPVMKPSDGDFRSDLKEKILGVLEILNRTEAPFMVTIYPYLSVMQENLPLEFGLFDRKSNYTVIDGDKTYTNIFDLKYDTLVWALRKNGFGHLKIIVSQVGWPTDGGFGADVKTAKRFYDGLLKKISSNKGTPLLPSGVDWDVYLYSLTDENWKNTERGPFERHYGIYETDGRPKFNLDFKLQGRDVELESARGVSYLPRRWCILNPDAAKRVDDKAVVAQYESACLMSDCTSLGNGSSCNYLSTYWKISYAFNNFFQMTNQEILGNAACEFDGLGMITHEKPEVGPCEFPQQILSTLFINGTSTGEMSATLGMESGVGEESRLKLASQLIVIIPFLWIFFSLT